jgi:hypothetical protein
LERSGGSRSAGIHRACERIGGVIGRLDDATMLKINRSFAVFVGIA